MTEIDTQAPSAGELFERAARTLFAFHSIRSKKLRVQTLDSTLQRLAECSDVLTWLSGDLADQVRETCNELARRLREAPPQQLVTIHGDLHLKQFVVGENGPRLLDFDRTRRSDPAEDLGSLLGNLRRRAINSHDSEEYDQLFQRFLGQYEAAGGHVDHRRIDLYAALRLIELAVEPFRGRHPDWVNRMRPFIAAAQRIIGTFPDASQSSPTELANARSSRFIEVTDPFNVASDESLPVSDVLDPYVADRRFYEFASADGEHAGIELKCVSVLRHRPGRRCVIEYAGRSRTTGKKISLIAKMNAKDRHQSQFDRQALLWNAGFHSSSPDGVSVARPWGVIPEWRMWLAEKARGQSSWAAVQRADGIVVAKLIANALAKVHNADLDPQSTHSIDAEMAILHDRLTAAAEQVPHLAARILSLLDACRRAAAEHRPGDFCPIHRDFYPDQVLVSGVRIVLVDFDLLSMGEAAVDVGNFRAHLFEHGLRYAEFAPAYAAADAAFIAEYLRLRPSVTAQQITDYTKLSLARHVSLCLSRPGRDGNLLRILEACERLVQQEVAANAAIPAPLIATAVV
jgi:aminoglycoside phosphotransferase (APT) family kinase protein